MVSCGVVPFDLFAFADGDTVSLIFEAVANPPSWSVQLFECGNPANVIVSTGFPGEDRLVEFLGTPPGNWQLRLRDTTGAESCWIESNCVVVA